MKIAVQLFGHLRDFESCAPTLRAHLLSKYNCDVFIHTWDKTDHNTQSWHNRKTNYRMVDSSLKVLIKKLYEPKCLKIEQQAILKETQIPYLYDKKLKFSTATLHFMFYSMNEANKLRKSYEQKENVAYDLVVVIRPDIQLFNAIDFEMIINQAKLLNLPTNRCRFFASKKINSNDSVKLYTNQPNDLLFFGTSEVIDRYIECNLNIDDEYAAKHCINIVSIYTSNEIRNNIIPIPIAYNLGEDWDFLGHRISHNLKYKNWSKPKKVAALISYYLFTPLRNIFKYVEKRYKWLIN